MIPGGSLKADTHVFLPMGFILFALLAFGTSQIILLFQTDVFLSGHFRMPHIWMTTHFLLLGFAVMVAMGAMYQLVPAVFSTTIYNETFGFIQLIVTIIGFSSFSLLIGLKPDQAIYGGIVAVVGILMFLLQMFLTIMKQREKNIVTAFVLGALVSLFLTIIAGFILVWSLTFESVSMYEMIFKSHITLGIAGWFSLLIFGFSYKLVPMFSLSHGFSQKNAQLAFLIYATGLIILNISYWFSLLYIQMLGWTFLLIGFSLFVLDIREILQKRLRRKLDKPLSFALLAILNGLLIHVVAFLLSIFKVTDPTIWSSLTFFYIIGWIIFSILGYLYKIVPFLWWSHRSARSDGKQKVPSIVEMTNEKLITVLFAFFYIGILGLFVGVIAQIASIVFLFQLIVTITSIVYIYSIVKIVFM